MRRTSWKAPFIVLITSFVVGGALAWRIFASEDSGNLSVSKTRAAQYVETLTIIPESYADETITTGTVRAMEQIDLKVEVSGKIVYLGFEEGATVSKDTLLLKVNDTELLAELKRAERRRDLARLRESRLAPLVASGGISETEYDEAKSEVSILDADMDLILEQIARHSVYAPFDGTVGLRYVSLGSYVTPSTRIATFQNTDKVRIEFYLPEKYASTVETGQTIQFSVVSEREEMSGVIYAVEPQIEETTRTLLVRAIAENPEGKLRPGAYARIVWSRNIINEAMFLPAVAVIQSDESDIVYVVNANVVEKRRVKIGTRVEGRLQIVEGLKPGESVVVSGVQQVRPGMQVTTDLSL